jgi:PIN domain nuclease of toxin-antitoxin system
MRVLLDTHVFLWWIAGDPILKGPARKVIGDRGNDCLVSIVSLWEIAIKKSLGKLEVPDPLSSFFAEQLAANEFVLLDLEIAHVAKVASLPFHHRDPFDRLLTAQAIEEKLKVVSTDRVFREYGLEVI